MQRTHDGGKSWQDIRLEVDALPDFFDESHWYAVNDGKFLVTDDAGKIWRETPIPQLEFVTQVLFLSRDVGWVVSTDLKAVAVSRTVDGGRTWTEARLTTAEPVSRVTDLFFLDATHGWLAAEYGLDEHGHGGSHLFSTVDGGATWVPEPDLSFGGEHRYMGPVRFLSPKTGFIFERIAEGAKIRNALVYTTDGGTAWRSVSLPRLVSACQIFEGDLRCSAGFSILTIHPK